MMPARTNATNLDGSKKGKTFKKAFKTTSLVARKNFKEDNFPEIVPPNLAETKLERKLQILPNEWFIESQFINEDVAATYAYWKPTKGPFLMVPSLERPEF